MDIKEKQKKNKKEYNKRYNKDNKDKIKKQKKEYYLKNRNEILKKKKEYSRRPKVKKRIKKYRKKNKEKVKRSNKEWKEKNPKYSKNWYQNNKKSESEKTKQRYKKPEVKARIKAYGKKYGKKYRKRPEVIVRRRERDRIYYQKLVIEENKRRKKLNLPLVGEGWTSEEELRTMVKRLFKYYKVIKTQNALKGWALELDIYIPALKLAFEYNGKQHYRWVKYFHPTIEEFKYQQYKDRVKKKLSKMNGIKLVIVKYDEVLSEQLILSKLKHLPNLITTQKTF